MNNSSRVFFADIARGMAVIYFMWCHAVNIHVHWIDTWAMPVFFVVMGMFYKPTATWREMIVKKVNTILVPFFLLSIPSYIQFALTLPFREFVVKLINPFACVHAVGWFLICIFWCYIIYYGINRLTRNKKVLTGILCVALSVISYYASTQQIMGHRILLPFFISTSLTVLPFICIGDFLRALLKQEQNVATNLIIASLFTICAWGVEILNFRGAEYIVNWYYGQDWFVVIPLSLIGTASILYICKFMPRFLSFTGEHSLLLLMVHPYVLRILRLFDVSNVFVITLIVTLVLTMLIAKYLPIVEGKKKVFK